MATSQQPDATAAVVAAATTKPSLEAVVVHPLVLLAVTDHYNRVAKDTRKRVIGVLLGETLKGRGEWSSDAKPQPVLWRAWNARAGARANRGREVAVRLARWDARACWGAHCWASCGHNVGSHFPRTNGRRVDS